MKRGGAPKGNRNAAKAKMCSDALRMELAMYEDKANNVERGQALRAVARTLIRTAIADNIQAAREIFDRMEGKPAQPIEGNVSHDHEHHHVHESVSETQGWVTEMLGGDAPGPAEKPRVN